VADANKQLESTLEEVKKLKKEHLVEIKSLGSPPNAVKVTLSGVVILQAEKIRKSGGEILTSVKEGQIGKREENYFETAKRYLLNDSRELMEWLQTFDKDNISPATMKKLEEKVLGQPEFNFAAVERCSFATKFLFMWVKAMVDYYKVFVETKPLREQLLSVRKIVEEKMEELRVKKAELEEINKKIRELEASYEEKMHQKQMLQEKISECELKLDRAQKLTDGLSEEKDRWSRDIQDYSQTGKLVPAHAIISAGMVAYSGPFTSAFRNRLEEVWVRELARLEIEHDPNVTMRQFLGNAIKIQQWNISGLPKDDTSTENGIIIDQTRR